MLPTGTGPTAQPFTILRGNYDGPLQLEAWQSRAGTSNVHICQGALTLAQAQDLIESGLSDVLMTVPGAGKGSVGLPEACDQITVLFEAANTSGQFQAVTVRAYDKSFGIVAVPRS
jgi:hypothetical protein